MHAVLKGSKILHAFNITSTFLLRAYGTGEMKWKGFHMVLSLCLFPRGME